MHCSKQPVKLLFLGDFASSISYDFPVRKGHRDPQETRYEGIGARTMKIHNTLYFWQYEIIL